MATVQISEPETTLLSMTHSIHRASSPSGSRLEARIAELEERLQDERIVLTRNQRDNCDLALEIEMLQERLEEANATSSQQMDTIRRKEMELAMIQKERDLLRHSKEEEVASQRKRFQSSIDELNRELDDFRRIKSKLEKEKNELINHAEKFASDLSKVEIINETLENKIEALETHNTRLKAGNEEMLKQLAEANAKYASLSADESERQKQLDKMTTSLNIFQRQATISEKEIDELKRQVQEESTSNAHLQSRHSALQAELEVAEARAEEDAENANQAQQQLAKTSSELAALRSKHERELAELQSEAEEAKRRLTARINELTEQYESEHSRVLCLERTKTQLTGQIHEIQIQLDSCQVDNLELKQELKSANTQLDETEKILEELQTQDAQVHSKLITTQKELSNARSWRAENEPKLLSLEKENRANSEKLKSLKESVVKLSKENDEMETVQVRAERERESLRLTVHELNEALQDAETKYQNSQNTMTQLRQDLATHMQEKEEELEGFKRSSHRTIEDLNAVLKDLESKHRSQATRLKKKMETTVADLERELAAEREAKDDIEKAAQEAADNFNQLAAEFDELSQTAEETRSALQLSESRRQTLSEELEMLRVQLEASERSRRKAESETQEITNRVSDLNAQVNSLVSDKRRLEGELTVALGDIEDLNGSKQGNEERIAKLMLDVSRLTADLQAEQDLARRADAGRRQLETDLRESSNRLKVAEQACEDAEKEAIRKVNAIEARLRDTEMTAEAEAKRGRELITHLRKVERAHKEVSQAIEEERSMATQMKELMERGQGKLKTMRRQVEEAEAATATANMKLRKAQEQLEEAEMRATMAERRASLQAETTRDKQAAFQSRMRSASFVREGSTFSLTDYAPRRSRRTPAFRSIDSEESDILNGVAD